MGKYKEILRVILAISIIVSSIDVYGFEKRAQRGVVELGGITCDRTANFAGYYLYAPLASSYG
jgi:hypothetical protein